MKRYVALARVSSREQQRDLRSIFVTQKMGVRSGGRCAGAPAP